MPREGVDIRCTHYGRRGRRAVGGSMVRSLQVGLVEGCYVLLLGK